MVRLELDQVVMRRMTEDDIEMVKALIKVCKQYSDTQTASYGEALGRCCCRLFVFFRRAAKAQKTASFFTSSLDPSAFSSWLFSPRSCVALSTPLSWLLLFLFSC